MRKVVVTSPETYIPVRVGIGIVPRLNSVKALMNLADSDCLSPVSPDELARGVLWRDNFGFDYSSGKSLIAPIELRYFYKDSALCPLEPILLRRY